MGCTPDTCTWFTNRFVIIKVDLKHLSRSDWFYCKMTRNKWRYIIFVCHFDPKTLLWKKRRHNVLHIGAPIVCVQPLEYLFDIGSFAMLVWLVCIWMYVHQTLQSKVEVETQFSMLESKKNSIDTDKYWNSLYKLLFIQNTQLTEYRRTQKKNERNIFTISIFYCWLIFDLIWHFVFQISIFWIRHWLMYSFSSVIHRLVRQLIIKAIINKGLNYIDQTARATLKLHARNVDYTSVKIMHTYIPQEDTECRMDGNNL